MAIIGETITELDIECLQGTENSLLRLLYYPTTSGEFVSNEDFVDYLSSSGFVDAMQDTMSIAASIVRISARQRGPDMGAEYTDFTVYPGHEAGDALPPWVAFSYRKVPDNSAIEGANTTPFRVGGFRLLGVPEARQNNGIVAPAFITFLNTFGNATLGFTIPDPTFTAVTYQQYMQRLPLTPFGPPDTAAPVIDVEVRQLLGSQNTRKYF